MGLEAPVGRTVHAGGGESTIDAQLSLAGLDVVGDLLQVIEALDVVLSVAGGGQQFLVVTASPSFSAKESLVSWP